MHDIKNIVENLEAVKKNLAKREFDLTIIDQVVSNNEKRKQLVQLVESKRAEVKKLSKEIGGLKKNGEDASELMSKVGEIKASVESSTKELDELNKSQEYILSTIPNLIGDDVPVGKDDSENKEFRAKGDIPKFDFEPMDHVDLGEKLGMLDFDRATKLTGSRFVIYKNHLARLERALANFMLDQHIAKGYEEIIPPFIVNSDSLYGTGQLPKFEEDLFKLKDTDWYLIPTAEVPITNMRRGELFKGSELPLKYCGLTPCFRSEAGSYGKDTRGLIRQHQFSKVELVAITHPEESEKIHDEMIDMACGILESLKLPYRAVILCTGDIGFGARKCVDLEVWLPGQDKFREISSLSNCWDFQARRASIRFRDENNKPQFAHTLNGSGLAVGRTLVAVMENYQQADGSIVVPEVLRPYMGGMEKIDKK